MNLNFFNIIFILNLICLAIAWTAVAGVFCIAMLIVAIPFVIIGGIIWYMAEIFSLFTGLQNPIKLLVQ